MVRAAIEQVVQAETCVPGMLAQLRSFRFPGGLETVVCEEQHLLSLKLSREPPASEGRFSSCCGPADFSMIGDLLLVPGQMPLQSRVKSSGTLTTLYCSLDRETFSTLTRHEQVWSARELFLCLDVRNNLIKEAMRRLVREVMNPGFATATLLDALRITISFELAGYLSTVPPLSGRGGNVLHGRQIRKITELVEETKGSTPTIAEMADLCNVSPRHLTRLFRQTTGQSIFDFVNARRIERARSWLAETAIPLKEIAFKLGFSDPSSFSRMYHRETGETPSSYRKRTGKREAPRQREYAANTRH